MGIPGLNWLKARWQDYRRAAKLRKLIREAKAMNYKPLILPPEDNNHGC